MRPSLHNVPAAHAARKNAGEAVPVRRRTEITFERETLSILHQPTTGFTAPCRECGRDVLKFTADAAAATIGITPREIYRWLEEQKLHFEESPTGQVYICSASLERAHKKELP